MSQEIHLTSINSQGNRHQRFAAAWARDANTIMQVEQCRMGRALNMGCVHTEELIRHPVQRSAGMWTAVQITEKSGWITHKKDIMHVIAARHGHPAATRQPDFFQTAKPYPVGHLLHAYRLR